MQKEYIVYILEDVIKEVKKNNYKYALVLIKSAVELIEYEMKHSEMIGENQDRIDIER